MSSLIEQAAKRLEQLKQAGVELPDAPPVPSPSPAVVTPPEPVAAARPPATSAASSRTVELNLEALSAAGILCPSAPRSQISDEYRIVKRPLIANAMGKGAAPIAKGNLICITSALPGEGKTFTAINLAMSIAAELDTTVMLVDADVARPSVLNVLGLPPAPGLLDVLTNDQLDLSQVLLKTNIEKLTILPSGSPQERATELLASDAMAHLLDDMASRYADRIIVFDSPPLLLATEARVLAEHMGQIVLVVRAEETLQSAVKHALAALENCPVKMTMLNQSRDRNRPGYGYGYPYGDHP